jgi:hypothetical protein
MIIAEISMGKDYHSQLTGKTIEEIIAKIKEYHEMTPFMEVHYSKKGKLESELKSGWYITKEVT